MYSWIEGAGRWLQHPQFATLFLDALLKSAAVLIIASAVCLAWRRGAASLRHLVWFLAVAGLLCLPGATRLLPSWQKPLWTVVTQTNSQNDLTVTLEFAKPASAAALAPRDSAFSASDSIPVKTANPARSRFATHLHGGWVTAVVTVWVGGALLIVLSIVTARVRLRALRRSANPPSNPEWAALLPRLCDDLGIRRSVTLLQSSRDVMPVTWGWWKPVVLLPAEASTWPAGRLRVVLLHELAHVKRWDCLTQLIAGLTCAVYWFNPLVWVAARRMCVERERACDDLVLNGGCKASEYAAHLVEISRAFRRVPQMAAIAMARSSNLENRVAAIVDVSRTRRASRALLAGMCITAFAAFLAVMSAEKSKADSSSTDAKPWFDAGLRAFFVAKGAQAHQLAGNAVVAPEVWPYFQAGVQGDWTTTTNLWVSMRKRAHQYEGTTADSTLDVVWGPILETELAWESFTGWQEKYLLAYGNDIIKSIPPGSIYFGGTDPGRGVITAMSENHAEGKPFYTITQNALADNTYLDYLRTMYGGQISTPTADDSQACFQEYLTNAQQRLAENKLKPGEEVKSEQGKVSVSGHVAVMGINALIAKVIFDHNTNQEFYIENSFPLDWMYPHLTPNGIIMKINREPLPALSDEMVQADREYWSNYIQPMIGDWLTYDTPVSDVVAFVEKVHLNHDLSGFFRRFSIPPGCGRPEDILQGTQFHRRCLRLARHEREGPGGSGTDDQRSGLRLPPGVRPVPDKFRAGVSLRKPLAKSEPRR